MLSAAALAVAGFAAAWPCVVAFAAAILVAWSVEWRRSGQARLPERTAPDVQSVAGSHDAGRDCSTTGLVRWVYADVALIVAMVRTPTVDHRSVGVAMTCVLAMIGLRACAAVADAARQRRRSRAVAWRNVGPGEPSPQRVSRTRWTNAGTVWAPWLSLPLYAGAVATCLGGWSGLLGAGAGISLLASAAILVAVVRGWRELGRRAGNLALDDLADALRRMAPSVVFYVTDHPASGTDLLIGEWLPALERLDPRVLVIVRARAEFDLGSALPTVLVSRARQLDLVLPPSVRLALYPANGMANNHLLRRPEISDAFVGDPDAGAVSRLSRVFDELWVSGPTARRRVLEAGVGIRDAQIREIGSPTGGLEGVGAAVDAALAHAVLGTAPALSTAAP